MIGVLFDKKGELTNFDNLYKIVVYGKDKSYKIVKEIDQLELQTNDIKLFRKSLSELLEKLQDCRIILGNQIIGIPFYFFDKNGFEICEAEKFSEEVLNEIYKDYIEKVQEIKVNELVNDKPIKLDEAGNYFLDLIKLQNSRPDISSKKALIPFLNHELFQTITIFASHVMPWLDVFLEQTNLKMTTERENGKYIIIIYHKICN